MMFSRGLFVMARSQFTVLMVEDTLEYAQLNLMVLRRQGFNVFHVADGDTAFAFLEEHKPDLILLDLNLPHVSGWDILSHCNALYGEGSTRVIVTSAYSDSANRIVGKLQDVYRYLIKPFTPQDLVKAIDNALGIETA